MLTKLTIRNFKQLASVDIELGDNVVLIGPNNSGKTTALQALALWEVGLRRWTEKRGEDIPPARSGVALNRKDLVAVPVPAASLLWRDRRYNQSSRDGGARTNRRVRIDVIVEGVDDGVPWTCGLEFDHENAESITCRPLRLSDDREPARMPIPEHAKRVRVAYLPPMSGLAATEDRLELGSISVRIGEGRTAEVLRNLCARVRQTSEEAWNRVERRLDRLFGVRLDPPEFLPERGEIRMSYRDHRGVQLDLSSAGRGLQQTLLLLTYLEANPGSVLLLDEPDAHLEVLRQGVIYDEITDAARASRSQIIAASHSEVLLNKAADTDVVVAFVGRPHRIDDRAKSQVAESLKEIGFDQYYQALVRGWVLYVEGSTDAAFLRQWARAVGHPGADAVATAFIHPIGGNQRSLASAHFNALREAKPDLVAAVILDRDVRPLDPLDHPLKELRWSRREIENYLSLPGVLYRWAAAEASGSGGELFRQQEAQDLEQLMRTVVERRTPPAALADPGDVFWTDTKVSDVYLPLVFKDFYERRGLSNLMLKRDFHILAGFMPASEVPAEVTRVLDEILAVASLAQPEADSPPTESPPPDEE